MIRRDAISIQVVGLGDEGVWEFASLAAAQRRFPELDPNQSTSNFTCAMVGAVNNEPALRFEIWAIYEPVLPIEQDQPALNSGHAHQAIQ